MSTDASSTLNSLLRGEISAAETYQQAIEKFQDELENAGEAQALRSLQLEHGEAVSKLTTCVKAAGGQPAKDSGAWGAFAQAVEGTAKLFGDTAALKALKEGEEHGLKEYNDALENSSLDPATTALLRDLAARQERHISTLNRLMETVS